MLREQFLQYEPFKYVTVIANRSTNVRRYIIKTGYQVKERKDTSFCLRFDLSNGRLIIFLRFLISIILYNGVSMAKILEEIGGVLTDWFAALAVLFFCLVIPLLPLKISYMIARTLSDASLKYLKKQRNTILGNMDVAFGTKMSEEEKMVAAREAITNMLKGFFETFYIASHFRKKN